LNRETRNFELPIGANVTANGVRFRVWAPEADRVEVVIFANGTERERHPLDRENNGYWEAHVAGIGAGTRYAYSVNGDDPRPDPASRFQPDGVHAPSQVVDPHAFQWTDDGWRGMALDDLIIYELHVGTATSDGTFDALIPKLPYFRDLGVTALEIMPIADFPGERNWGYDGVDLYAPARCYGGPDAFKRLVDAAHAHGLAIILDVVYNHFGPDGNYLRVFSPHYFTEAHHTPWGAALNLDQQGSGPVREFLINNALYWAHEYHIDGLRLDATHALIDDSETHLLKQLATDMHRSLPQDRVFVITVEDERNDAKLAQPQPDGYGLDAVWADDFHHQARIALTGEQHGYYADYSGSIPDLAKTITGGWFYQGQRSTVQNHPRGTSPLALRYEQFVYCIQNHDQIGNRPIGDRLNHLVDPHAYRALSALLLLAPETPLLFQGQEWAAATPFQFFTDHNPELGRLVTEGRRREFAYFLTETGIQVPDPQARSTFERSKLDWNELDQPEHIFTLNLYRDLIALRRSHPALRYRDRESVHVTSTENAILIQREAGKPNDALMIVIKLDQGETTIAIKGTNRILLDTNHERYGGTAAARLSSGELRMTEPGVVVLTNA
jgi:maltooligosyltrehalose trehalohydrolase